MKNFFCKILLFFFPVFLVSVYPTALAADDLLISVSIFENTYSGVFSGSCKNGIPEGEGQFIYSEGSDGFVLSGNWKDGFLTGSVLIEYDDGASLQANCQNGLINGNVTKYASDGSFQIFQASDGRPYGLITSYTKSGKISGYDHFYQMQSVNTLKSKSTTADYGTLFSMSLISSPLKVSGTVIAVFDTKSNAYVLISDSQNQLYVLTWGNIYTSKYNQAIVPNLSIGDSITAFGFLQKQSTLNSIDELKVSIPASDFSLQSDTIPAYSATSNLSDISVFYHSTELPFLQLFAADLSTAGNFDRSTPSYDYNDVAKNPYLYDDLEWELSATVLYTQIDAVNHRVYLVAQEENASDNLYYVRYDYSDDSLLPAVNNKVLISGTFDGNAKQLLSCFSSSISEGDDDIWIIFPRFYSKALTILQ